MFRRVLMNGSQIKLDDIFPGIRDINDPDFNNWGMNAKSSGKGYNPQITFHADEENENFIYLAEHPTSAPDEFIWLRPGATNTYDWSTVQAMNIFYATGQTADILFIVCR